MAYDYDDRLLSKQSGLERFTAIFNSIVKGPDCQGGFKVDLRFVHCNHSGHPAYAQNDALMAAYAANMDYLYMVNDDTDMITPGWTEPFIKKLSLFDPPNVGLVGPSYKAGNTVDLTYNFVHRTHVDIFKSFYPRLFTDWFADQWISRIYLPNNVRKFRKIRIRHTMELGTRYKRDWELRRWLAPVVNHSRYTYLRKYLEDNGIDWDHWNTKRQPDHPYLNNKDFDYWTLLNTVGEY